VYHHPWAGIDGSDINSRVANAMGLNESKGVLVIGVTPGSPADLAGITVAPPPHSAVIVGIDQKEVRTLSDILRSVDIKSVGDNVILKVWKDGNIHTFGLKLKERPPAKHA
ncbi:MAG: PDZ domain-containing protein, partial [Thermoproteota archaeon]|nr:PDZ domain-containing protein [Thermoproteota archaeon]